MLKKRIIPCLDIKDGRTVKGINFVDLIDAGDPVELAEEYIEQGADELVFLDISATTEQRGTLLALVERIAVKINIPFTVGGGINTVEQAIMIIQSGADKICLNSAAIHRPVLISEIAERLGSQCVVVAVDTKWDDNRWDVYINGGTKNTGINTLNWVKRAEQCGAGEILLTSMNNDGTKSGFALDITKDVCNAVNIPVIASGGAGNAKHFLQVFEQTDVSAALAASIFHFGELTIPDLKSYLKTNKIFVR